MYSLYPMIVVVCLACAGMAACAAESPPRVNLLRNPGFGFSPRGRESKSGHNVACWNTDAWGDIEVKTGDSALPVKHPGNTVRIKPGKRFWQFASLPDLDLLAGDRVSMEVSGFQKTPGALVAHLALMLVESGNGTWSPKALGLSDARTFQCHGRGELLRSPDQQAVSPDKPGAFTIGVNNVKIDPRFKVGKNKSSTDFRNIVGVLVEFVNRSEQDVWVYAPRLARGSNAKIRLRPSRQVPEFYRRIPRTIDKLMHGKPVCILTLGSSIDRGSANPRQYLYNEDPRSPDYRKPVCESKPFLPDKVGRPDLKGYVAWWQHYFMYTGRMRLELLRKFNYPVKRILLNVMACDGSCIGESHSGFREYCDFVCAPNGNRNGHSRGMKWSRLYPDFFKDGKPPKPDLVIFGHGHNEHIDRPDEVDAYEGAIRWFQRHYPGVEFAVCMWIRDKGKKYSMTEPMQQLSRHYGLPFVDVGQFIIDIKKTCNYYALAPDGGHPQAGAHYLWFKQLEQIFEVPANPKPGIPQKQFPARFNQYSYGWEGDLVTFKRQSPRIVDQRMMIIEDCTLNVWARHASDKEVMQIRIDGRIYKDAGRGRNSRGRDVRNSSFVYGRLSVGDRHVLEITGNKPEILAVDCKVCLGRKFIPVGADAFKGALQPEKFVSAWGAPYGKKMLRVPAGKTVRLEVMAGAISVAYVDREAGGTLQVFVDDEKKLACRTDKPFVDSTGRRHFMENRHGVTGLKFGRHRVELRAVGGEVAVLGVFTYDTRTGKK